MVALRDGYVDMPTTRLRQAGDRPFGFDLPAQVELVDGRLRLSANAFLVIDHGEHILIDAGAANAWEPTMGSLLDALSEARVARAAIRTVAVTHAHEDHVNGLVSADGTDAFPNLERLFIPQKEVAIFDESGRRSRFRQRRSSVRDGFQLWAHRLLRHAVQPGFYVAGAHLALPGVRTGFATSAIDTTASVRLVKKNKGFGIDHMSLRLEANVAGIDGDTVHWTR